MAKQASILPGDKLIFKGGVTYRGGILISKSGLPNNLVTYDGNTENIFGQGKAILDGSNVLSGWQITGKVINGHQVYVTDLPAINDFFTLNLYQGDQKMILSQTPNPIDFYRTDDLNYYFEVQPSNITPNYVIDPANINNFGSLEGTYAYIWAQGNNIYPKKITGFNQSEGKFNYDTISSGTYTDRKSKYAIVNNNSAMDLPGEYYVDMVMKKLYVIPHYDLNSSQAPAITYSSRAAGFDIRANYVAINNFIVQKYVGATNGWRDGVGIRVYASGIVIPWDGIIINNNEVRFNSSREYYGAIFVEKARNSVVSNNYVHHNFPNRGILVGGDRIDIINNTVSESGHTGIALFGATNSKVLNNKLNNLKGVHANGITLYLGSNNCLVYRNIVLHSNIALTTQSSANIVVAFNIFNTEEDTYTVADWGGGSSLWYINNMILNSKFKSMYINSGSLNGLIVKNNIMDGGPDNSKGNVTHNIYTSLAWYQRSDYGWKLAEGEKIQLKSALFIDYNNDNYKPANGSNVLLTPGAQVLFPDNNNDFEGKNISSPFIGPYSIN